MKIFRAVLFMLIIDLLIFVNCDENEIKIKKYKLIKKLNSFYNDLISGKLSANSKVVNFLNAKTNNYDRDRCNSQLAYYMNQFNNETNSSPEMWALELFDSSGKLPDGALYANKYSLGNFDQCLEISSDVGVEEIGIIKGQYCIVPMVVDLQALLAIGTNTQEENLISRAVMIGGQRSGSSLSIINGVCVPDTCEPTYIMELIGGFLEEMNITLIPSDPSQLCTIDSPTVLNTADIFMIIIISLFTAIMFASTAYDIYTSKTQASKKDLFMAFSIITNGRKLFALDQSKSSDVIGCLNGIRVLSLVWIILGHTYMFAMQGAILNMFYLQEWMGNVFTMLIAATNLGVDSFFLMSGLLVTWSVFKEMNKTNGKLNIPIMYFHRYLRLTPPLIMLMLFSASFFVHTGIGPFSKLAESELVNCENWWWTTLLYIQNYVNPNELCIPHSWYLQVDMQLFILSPLLLIPLWKWGRNVLPVIFTLIFVSVGWYFAVYYANDFRISFFNGGAGGVGRGDTQTKIYYPTHTRMGTWLIGVLLAYLLIKTKNKKLNISTWYIYGGWLLCFAILASVIFGALHINQPGYIENSFESSIYSAFHRVGWCTALAWLIFACHKGYGGYINSFLSHPMWFPFTRLSYSMYLLSYILQGYRIKISKVHQYFSEYSIFNEFWGDFGITFTVAIFWVLAFESPIPILEKVIFRQKSKPQNNMQVGQHVTAPVEVKTSLE